MVTNIREMDAGDISACASIFCAAYEQEYSEPWTQEAGEERLRELFQNTKAYCLVAEANSIVIGFLCARTFAWYDGRRLWIEELVVDREHRSKGIGSALLSSVSQHGQKIGIVSSSLLSKAQSKAFSFYLKNSYAISSWLHLETASGQAERAIEVDAIRDEINRQLG